MRFETALGNKKYSQSQNGLIPDETGTLKLGPFERESVYYKALVVSRFKMNDLRSFYYY